MTPSLVVLTDFYAVTNRALSYAAGLAVPLGAQLVLLHVRLDPLLGPSTYHRADSPRGQHQTRQALLDLAADQPVPTTVDVAGGFLPEAVTEAVCLHHPLFLVLARPGQDADTAEFVTGTAVDVLRHAPYPLLVVPAVGWDVFPPRRLLIASLAAIMIGAAIVTMMRTRSTPVEHVPAAEAPAVQTPVVPPSPSPGSRPR